MMSVKGAFLSVVVLLAVSAVPAAAQQTLGELVAQGGYDWLIGKWVATTDEGNKIEFEQKWGLDKHVILVDFKMGDFKLCGMIIFVPSREEIIQVGADSRGGTWKGTWRDEYGSAVHSMEHTSADGEIQKAEIVHTKVDAETMKAAMYGLDSDGYRTSEPWTTLTYKRQTAPSASSSASDAQGSRGAAQGSLGDLLSQYGYEWMIGKWLGTDSGGQAAEVEYALTLDGHVGLADVKIDEFRYHGMIMLVPSREEIIQVGADNRGGLWQGTWNEDYEGAVNRQEYLRPDGSTVKMEHVYAKVDDGTFKIKQYDIDTGGYRASTPRGTMTYKRQKAKAVQQ